MTHTSAHAHLVPSKPLTERQIGIDEGYQAAVNDAESGALRGIGIYTTSQVIDFVDMYKTAVQQSILNDIKGIYRLGEDTAQTLHLVEQVIKQADSKFSGLLKAKDHVQRG